MLGQGLAPRRERTERYADTLQTSAGSIKLLGPECVLAIKRQGGKKNTVFPVN